MLSKTAFDDIINQVEFKLDINLFACRINNQIPKSVSFKPDLEFIAVNAFNMDWGDKIFYIFSPFIFVQRIMQKNGRTENLAW